MKRQLLMADPAGSSRSSCSVQIGERCAGAALQWAQGALSSGLCAQSTAWKSSQVSCKLPASPAAASLCCAVVSGRCHVLGQGLHGVGLGGAGWRCAGLMGEMGCVGGLGILAVQTPAGAFLVASQELGV